MLGLRVLNSILIVFLLLFVGLAHAQQDDNGCVMLEGGVEVCPDDNLASSDIEGLEACPSHRPVTSAYGVPVGSVNSPPCTCVAYDCEMQCKNERGVVDTRETFQCDADNGRASETNDEFIDADPDGTPPPASTANNATNGPGGSYLGDATTIRRLDERVYSQCSTQASETDQCCGDPLRCMDGTEGTGALLLQIGLGMGGGLAQTQAGLGLAKACKTMKSVSTATAAMNFALAGKCNSFVNQCQQNCESILVEAEQEIQQMESRPPNESAYQTDQVQALGLQGVATLDTGTSRRYQQDLNTYQSNLSSLTRIKRRAQDSMNSCEESKRFAEQQKIAAASQAAITALAVKCQDQTDTGLDSIADNQFNVDCSVASAAANPVCQQQCSRPGAESIPMCQAFLNNNPQFAGLNLGDGQITTSADIEGDGLFDLDPLGDEEQLSDPEFITPENAGLATAQGSGGGGGGGLGPAGGGGGGAAAGGGGAGGQLDLNSKLLRGVASGRGFSAAGGTLSGGGFKGYNRGGARGPASAGRNKGKKFNLRDFLPGGKKAKKRGLAALGNARPEIGAKTENIFKRISNRFQAVCLEDRLYDCDTLRKTKSK